MLLLSACLCFKDSASYLDEWLLFHRFQGFDYFYLYDNDSSDDYLPVVQPWIDAGLATLLTWPGLGQQQEIYDHCLGQARHRTRWLAFIDDDEFLFSPSERKLPAVLDDYDDVAGVGVSWVVFGSAGLQRREAGWVTERFDRCTGYADQHVKCVVRPERVTRSQVVGHSFVPRDGLRIVDENRRTLAGPLNDRPSAKVLRLNHYLVKSWEEFLPRRTRAQVNTGEPTVHGFDAYRQWDVEWSRSQDRSLCALRAACERCHPARDPRFQTR